MAAHPSTRFSQGISFGERWTSVIPIRSYSSSVEFYVRPFVHTVIPSDLLFLALTSYRIRTGETYLGTCNHHPQGSRPIQRGRSQSGLWILVCQLGLQHQYLYEPLLSRHFLDVCQRRPQAFPVSTLSVSFLRAFQSVSYRSFRPMPKFLCVKGILFFSFWQSLFISILVAAGAITKLGPYTDPEHISLGLTDTLICLEMPFFAIAHQYAFSTRDYVDPLAKFVARMPIYYAFRDAFGLKDVVEDSKATLRGEGMDYREFEPSEGQIHQGAGRDRRIRAGLRYSQGGKRKYWLPQTANSPPGAGERRLNRAIEYVTGRPDQGEEVYAPLLDDQADDVVHIAPDLRPQQFEDPLFGLRSTQEGGFELPFGDLDDEDEELYEHSKKYIFGDYNYPCVDISNEEARIRVWNEEERILRDERGIFVSPSRGPGPGLGRILGSSSREGYGAVGNFQRPRFDSDASSNNGGSRHGKNTYSPSMRQAVIDKEQDRWDNATTATSHSHSQGELRLQWTRTKAKTPSPNLTPRLRTISSQGPDQASSSSLATPSPSQGGSPRDRWKPSSSIHPEPDNDHSTLPPDAVDLIVEDNRALQAEMTHERRKGEPAVRPHGLRKVYRRGYVVEEDEGRVEGEVEVEDPDPDSGGRGEDGRDLGAVLQVEEEAVETIARAVTPPAHARIFVDSYALGSEDNPWA